MSACIRVHETGGPEVLKYENYVPYRPGEGEVLIRQTAVGVNPIDLYHRSGLYPVHTLPFIPGLEAAGVIEDKGPETEQFKTGQRVAYATAPLGAYATHRVMPIDRLVPLPDAITDEQAAAMMLKGLTAEHLLRRTYVVRPGDTVLIHAAAAGIGLIVSQWAKSLGATVIGTVASPEKADLARSFGVDFPIHGQENLAERVKEITGGRGVPVVYDSGGREIVDSLDCLQPHGLMVNFGQASSRDSPAAGREALTEKGDLHLARPSLIDYIADINKLRQAAALLFDVVGRGDVKISIGPRFPLAEAAAAHRALEAGEAGSIILLP